MFTRGLQRITIRLGDGRALSFARISEGMQMDIVDVGNGTMVLTVVALAELRDGEEVVIARTGLEVTTRQVLGNDDNDEDNDDDEDDDEDDDSDYDGDGEDSGSGRGEESDTSTSESAGEQGDEREGGSDVESDSDEEYYQEEIHGRQADIDLSYEGTLALLAALATGNENGEGPRRPPRVSWADEERSPQPHPLPALYVDQDEASPPSTPSPEETRNALHAVNENYRSIIEQNDADDLLEYGSVVFDDGLFETLVDIGQRHRRDPDERDRNGISEAAAAPLRRAGVEWRELVNHMRAQDAESV